MNRTDILATADNAVSRDRNATHGEPENSFAQIAAVWSALIGVPITPEQVTILLTGLKAVRAWHNPGHLDNWVDMCGYPACGGEIATEASA